MYLEPMTQATMEYMLSLYPTATRDEIQDIYSDTPEFLKTLIDPKYFHPACAVPDINGIAILRLHAVLKTDKKAKQAARYCMFELIARYATPKSQVRTMLDMHGVDSF